MPEIAIRPFAPSDQDAVRALVLAGLADHFGELDPTFNHDLDDIASTYVAAGAVVIVAECDARIVGVGTLIQVEPEVSRLVRMSVARSERGRGLGKRLVFHLLDIAHARGDRLALVETNADWSDAIALYLACGFTEIQRPDGDVHFSRPLDV